MTTVQAEKIARRKLSLLQLAQELGNVSKEVLSNVDTAGEFGWGV
jgi:hypothetical protein